MEKQKIALWGVGDWGVRIVSSIQPEYRRRVKIVAVDSDLQSLICSPVTHKIQIGDKASGGRGAGGDTGKGEEAFRESEAGVRENLDDCRALLIVGGLGGGVGSGAIPALCECARELDIFTLAFVTRPFIFEGKKKKQLFQQARKKIEESSTGLACFFLDRLVGKVEDDTPHEEVFHYCDRILKESVECVIGCLSAPPPRGGDYASIGNLFSSPGETIMGVEETNDGQEHLVTAVKGALSALSLSPAELGMARGFLVQIEAGRPIPFRRVEQAIGTLSGLLGEDVELLYTVSRNEDMGEKCIVRIMAAGIPEQGESNAAPAIPVTMTADRPPPKQTLIDFKKLARGVFSDTDPTLLDGEDLDIPTFARKGISLE